jgi:hypothetical protein
MTKKDSTEMLQSSIDKVASSVENLAIMMKEGFDEIHDKFATKEDLKRFATKEDLVKATEKLVTKEDLVATNKRINDAITKEDYSTKLMKDSYDELAASTGARIRQENKIDKNKDDIVNHKNILNKHETRIKKLELSSV